MTRAAAVQRTDQRMHAVAVGDEPAHQLLDHEGEGQDALVGGVGVHALDATRGRGGGQWTLGTPDVGTGADLRDSSGTGGDGLIGGDADALCGGGELRAAIVAVVADPRSGLPPTLGPEADTRTGLRPIPAACSEGLYWNRGRGVPHQHDPLMASESAGVQARSHARAVVATLRARGIEVSLRMQDDWKLLAGLPIDRLMAAAVACTGEADFRRRIADRRGLHAELPRYPDSGE